MKGAFDRRVEVARVEATEQRAQVLSTIAEVRSRLDPKIIIAETATSAFGQVNRLIGDATAGAKSRPWLLAVGATLFGIVVSLRTRQATDDNDGEIDATKPAAKS